MKKPILIEEDLHSEDLEEIISKPPSWLLTRGITFVFLTILLIIGMSFFIRYPELVQGTIKFNTENAPKVITSKVNGSLTKLLVKDGATVEEGTEIAYLESTADHSQILILLEKLQILRNMNKNTYDLERLISPNSLNLGELQGSYQTLYSAYLNFKASSSDGIFQTRKGILLREIDNVNRQYVKSLQVLNLQQRQLELAEEDFEKYKILAQKKVISPAELLEKESLLLAKRQYIPQMESSLISYEGSILAKNKELNDLDSQISDEQKKFIHALNSFISQAENWKKQYVVVSNAKGKLIFGSFLQENQQVKIGQELFLINTNNEAYYGELLLAQSLSAKVRKGQNVLIKVRSYPYQEYGYLHGKISYLSDIPLNDSAFFVKIHLIRFDADSLIKLKPGLYGDTDIITDDQSIFKKIWNNLTKNLKF